jgi:hypothetical protein
LSQVAKLAHQNFLRLVFVFSPAPETHPKMDLTFVGGV